MSGGHVSFTLFTTLGPQKTQKKNGKKCVLMLILGFLRVEDISGE